MKKFSLLMLWLQCFAVFTFAQYPLKGVVKSENGEVLPGAAVLLKNTFQGTVTNSSGEFQIKNLKAGNYRLNVSFIGYKTKQVDVIIPSDKQVEVKLAVSNFMTEEVLVSATRANGKMPVAFSTVSKEEISGMNMGQDIPYLLSLTPSFVATSDAGTGIGYTNFRIRGTDLNRINVTINGVPMNDAESHGTFWVDVPDLAASTENIQVQRGVGTSTNGAAAFGATINLQTTALQAEPYAEYAGSAGSFHTFRNSVSVGTGLINGKFAFDARLSKVNSEGFIDRASADLKSFFVSAAWYAENSILKATVFSGFEETYQAWNGVPSVRLNNDLPGMQRYGEHGLISEKQTQEMIASDNRTYNMYTYENEVDHYQQDYYQLHFSHKFNPYLNLNTSLHWTYGRGYYENFKENKKYGDYLLTAPAGLSRTDLVVRKWLDNDFYGVTFSLNYNKNKSAATLGGGYSTYDGDHFGRVIWAKNVAGFATNHEWYRGTGLKKDFNLFGKYNYRLSEKINLYADLQYRHIDYTIDGIDDDLRDISQSHQFDFFNPKAGVYFQPAANQEAYLSFARANREPNRDNYTDADPAGKQPVAETLNDLELGYSIKSSSLSGAVNLYYMFYHDQLILTGKINDVGAPVMVNADDSYRAGVELQAGWKIGKTLTWNVNATFSTNKIRNFTEYIDNWDTWEQDAFELGKTDLAFSPSVVAGSNLQFQPGGAFSISLISSYVGDQFIDNTSSDERKLDAYFVNHLKVDYTIRQKLVKEMKLNLLVNNLFNTEYESNAWVYSYLLGGERFTMDGYFPQAGIHFFVGLNVRF
jgi:iron complex outermembrane receptor protein